jgi:hypothetical protein
LQYDVHELINREEPRPPLLALLPAEIIFGLKPTKRLTGVDDPNPAPTVPIAMFGTLRHVACVGEAVKFINASYNSDLIDYTWTFPADADICYV